MINYPVLFDSNAQTVPGINVPWISNASCNETNCAIPKEFDGPGGALSPEDFFLLAIQNCFIGTFKVFADYSKLTFGNLKVTSKLVVNKDESGKPWMQKVHLIIEISEITNEKKLQLLISKTFESGFILRSVKTEISHEIHIR